MKRSDVLKCCFNNWYENFQHLTVKSIFIAFPQGFKDYLLEDGVILPSSNDCLEESHGSKINKLLSDNSSDEESNWDDCSDSSLPKQAPEFKDFDCKIRDAIIHLGGKVFPKLNWSSPRDASWIALNNSCCCTCIKDIYLLLKSSSLVAQDLAHPFRFCDDTESSLESTESEVSNESHNSSNFSVVQPVNCQAVPESTSTTETPYFLILRQWNEINPNTEYRCFVKDNSLIGISQRDLTVFSQYNVSHKSYIVEDILNFFIEEIQYNFPNSNYVFDVARIRKNTVTLIDFGVFGKITDPLLFDWDELTTGKITCGQNMIPEYRCLIHNRGIQPNKYSHYALPQDIIDITSGEDSFKFADLLKLVEGRTIDESSDED